MEGGHAEVAGELGGAFLEAGEELRDGERDGRDSVEVLADADEDEDQREVERVGEGLEEVEDGLVETEQVTDNEADQRGGTHDGEDPEREAEGDAPCKFLRAGALPELAGDGADNPALEAALRGWRHREEFQRRAAGFAEGRRAGILEYRNLKSNTLHLTALAKSSIKRSDLV